MAKLGTRSLTISVGGTDFTADVSNCRIASRAADADFVSFADAAAGGAREYYLAGTIAQDPAASSLWDKIWASAGTTAAVIIAPAGGVTASPTQPKFTGNVVITEPDGDLLGGEANASPTARFTTDIEWVFTAKPVRAFA